MSPRLRPFSDEVARLDIALLLRALRTDARFTDARPPLTHSHGQPDVTSLVTDLAARELVANRNAVNGYAGLDATGKVGSTQMPFGVSAGTACEGHDGRLSDARSPLAHTHVQADVSGLAAALRAA